MHELARRMVEIARHGLRRRGVLDSAGNDETGFLAPLKAIVDSGQTNADMMLAAYYGAWKEDASQIYSHYKY